jgi:CBS domain-containing protein
MSNTISTRIADFLKMHPPFDLLTSQQLVLLCERMQVRYVEKEEKLFEMGNPPEPFFFVVKEGAVALEYEQDGHSFMVDLCDEGDVFGLRPLIAGDEYRLAARATENSLIYLIPTKYFQPIMESNPRIAYYLASNFASDRSANFKQKTGDRYFMSRHSAPEMEKTLVEVQTFDSFRSPVTCGPDHSIKEAAVVMTREDVGSIIVTDKNNYPLGILTDTDLRRKVATGMHSLDRPVREIMSSPVITFPPGRAVADVQICMIEHQVHHLCITQDGTDQSAILGVISEHDLLVTQGNSPAILVREIRKSTDAESLRALREKAEILLDDYLEQEVAISFISMIMSEINDAIIEVCIQLSIEELEGQGRSLPEAGFCWLALGSEGRKEQLLRTDQDNALVFADVPEEQLETIRKAYLDLARLVTQKLNTVGFEYCPADMMASNPKWCLSLTEWKKQFAKWIFQPGEKEVMYSTIFFDYRPVFGDTSLADKMTEGIYADIDKQKIFLSFLAKNAMQNPPPLSFFRNFIVERNGEHKDEFDIKARAMMPLVDAARVLILHARIGRVNNTFERFEKMAELEPQNSELFEQAADAYEILMRFRAMQGLKNKDSGRFFKPGDLNKMQRMMLRNSFQPIDELQKLLKRRFQLGLMG